MTAPLVQATGRRKRAVARVRFSPGDGTVVVNGLPALDYFPTKAQAEAAIAPLSLTETDGVYDVSATIHGGGKSGHGGALRLGIARGLVELDPELRDSLKKAGFLRRDPRKKESKKYGLKKARKAPQYSKR